MKKKYLAHYRLTNEGKWNLYINGEIVAIIKDPISDAEDRFGRDLTKQEGRVNIDVLNPDYKGN